MSNYLLHGLIKLQHVTILHHVTIHPAPYPSEIFYFFHLIEMNMMSFEPNIGNGMRVVCRISNSLFLF